jgi:hypothetical protein
MEDKKEGEEKTKRRGVEFSVASIRLFTYTPLQLYAIVATSTLFTLNHPLLPFRP